MSRHGAPDHRGPAAVAGLAKRLASAGPALADPPPCEQCGEANPGWIVNPVCGRCCRRNHAKVVGR